MRRSNAWNKAVNSSSGQCNYLGSGHVTEINVTQSSQPLSLIHDKVHRFLLSMRKNGSLGEGPNHSLLICYRPAMLKRRGDSQKLGRYQEGAEGPSEHPSPLAHLYHSPTAREKGKQTDHFGPSCLAWVLSVPSFPAGGPSVTDRKEGWLPPSLHWCQQIKTFLGPCSLKSAVTKNCTTWWCKTKKGKKIELSEWDLAQNKI